MARPDTNTGDLFAYPQPAAALPGSMDYRATLSHLLAETLRKSGKDRHDIAHIASKLTGHNVSKHMLDGYTAESREEFNLPFWVVPAIENACGSFELTNWLVAVRGGRLLIGRDALEADLGRITRQREQLVEQERALRALMRGSR